MQKFPNPINSKLPRVGTTIFTVMSKLATENKAINLSQGFPDFEIDPGLIDLTDKAMRDGFNQYAPMQGLISLRETISVKYEKMYGAIYDPEHEINICSGATEGIFSAIAAFISEDDEAIIFTPAYDCYGPAVELNGGKCVYVELNFPEYSVDWKEVQRVMNRKTKMIIINTPHNPSGTVLKKEDMEELERITKGTDIIIISDEVYEHIVFDGQTHESVCKYPGLAERSILVFSFGKMFHITGWKMGFVLAPSNLMTEFRKAHQYIVFASNTPAQIAFNEYLKNESHYLGLGEFYQEQRDYFVNGLKGSRFKINPAEGTYFQLLGYSAISEEKDTDYAIRLTKENKVASIPVSVFYQREVDNKVLRFCFAKRKETLDKALEILQKV